MPPVADSQFVGPEVTRGHSKETATRARLKCCDDPRRQLPARPRPRLFLASPLTPDHPACRADERHVAAVRFGLRTSASQVSHSFRRILPLLDETVQSPNLIRRPGPIQPRRWVGTDRRRCLLWPGCCLLLEIDVWRSVGAASGEVVWGAALDACPFVGALGVVHRLGIDT